MRDPWSGGMLMAKTILLVDDNEEEREIFSTYLRFVGGRVLEAGNGREGIERALEHAPDLILMDLRMPHMDGWEAMEHLSHDPRTARIPVLALTARSVERERVSRAGFCGYLEKPLAPYAVMREVERCVGRLEERWGPGAARPSDAPGRGQTTTR